MNEQELHDALWSLIAPGFMRRADVSAAVAALVGGTPAVELVDALWELRLKQLREPVEHPTDDERVERAFEALRAEGVFANMNFGVNEANGVYESEAVIPFGTPFAFFHQGDTARLGWPPAELSIFFGTPDAPGPRPNVGEQVRAAFEQQGLSLRWEGTVDDPIHLEGIVWMRPLPRD